MEREGKIINRLEYSQKLEISKPLKIGIDKSRTVFIKRQIDFIKDKKEEIENIRELKKYEKAPIIGILDMFTPIYQQSLKYSEDLDVIEKKAIEVKNQLKEEPDKKNELEGYKSYLKDLQSQIRKKNTQKEEIEKKIKNMENRIKELQEENDKLLNDGQKYEEDITKKEELENKRDYLDKRAEDEKIRDTKNKINRVLNEIDKLTYKKDGLKSTNNDIKERLVKKNEQYFALEAKLNEMNEEMKKKEDFFDEEMNKIEENYQIKNLECLMEVENVTASGNDLNTMIKENNDIKKEIEQTRIEGYTKIEKLKQKLLDTKNGLMSYQNLIEIFSDYFHLLYKNDISLNYEKMVIYSLNNFESIVKQCFNPLQKNNNYYNSSIIHENLKNCFFLIFIRALLNKNNSKLNNEDINNNDLLTSLSNELYEKNIVSYSKVKSSDKIEEISQKINNLNLDEYKIKSIQENFMKKVNDYKTICISEIKSLLIKCAQIIINNNITLDGEILFEFDSMIKNIMLIKNETLIVDNNKLNNNLYEYLLTFIKFPNCKISKIQFSGDYNYDIISENKIAKLLYTVLYSLPNIISLNISLCSNLTNLIKNTIIEIIPKLSQLKIISLEGDLLGDFYIKKLSDAILFNKNIIALILSKNDITSDGIFYLSSILSKTKIDILYLSGNQIQENGLFNLLSNIKLKISILDLSDNNFKMNDFDSLATFIKKNPEIKLLNISKNFVDDQNAVILGDCLKYATKIETINMSEMNIVSVTSAPIFTKIFCSELIIDNNLLEDIGFIMLFNSLSSNTTLKKLSLKKTKISSIGIQHLCNFINKSNKITDVHLEGNQLAHNDIKLLNECTSKIKNIKIYLDKNILDTLHNESLIGIKGIDNNKNLIWK